MDRLYFVIVADLLVMLTVAYVGLRRRSIEWIAPNRSGWKIWQAPVYEDPALTRQSRLVQGFALGIMAIAVSALPLIGLLQREFIGLTVLTALIYAALCLSTLALNRRGFHSAAGILLVVGFAADLIIKAVAQGGVRSPGLSFIFVLALISALLFGEAVGLLTGAVAVAINLGFAVAETTQVLPPASRQYNVWVLWALNATHVCVFVLSLRMSMKILREATKRGEEELTQRRVAEQRLELALDAGNIGVWEMDRDGSEFVGDARGFDVFRLPVPPHGRLSFGEWASMVHPDDRPTAVAALEELRSGARNIRFVYRIRRTDGVERHVEATASAVFDKDRRSIGVVGVASDVTERRKAELERQRMVFALGERVKELRLLHSVSHLLEPARPFDRSLLEELVEMIPSAWQYPEACEARISYGEMVVSTATWGNTQWKLSAPFASLEGSGTIEVAYKEDQLRWDDDPFLPEERLLIGSLAEMLQGHLERDVNERGLRQAREALEASEAFLRNAFLAAPAMIVISDLSDGYRVVEVNDAFERITGFTQDEVLGLDLSNLSLYDDPSAGAEILREALEHGHIRERRYSIRTKGGDSLTMALNVEVFAVGATRYAIYVSTDITEAEKAAAKLDEYSRHLEELVEKRTDELRRARDAADEANRAKGRFLANMSHEIRTPMNAVLGFTSLLMRDSQLGREQHRHLQTISQAGESLLELIDGILQLAKVESGHETLSETGFDLPHLLESLRSLFEPQATAKGLSLSVHIPPTVPRFIFADEGKLRRVISNLLGNALKFTSHGSAVVRVDAYRKDGNHLLRFEVEDSGPGIAASEMPRLFEKFEQTEAGRSSGQGTGLGLAISKELARLMGGELSVDAILGRGSRFTLTIPFREASAADVPRQATPPRAIRLGSAHGTRRILVADDSADNRRFLTTLLSTVGFETREATNGHDALREFERWSPDLILMDVRMPEMDGMEAIQRLRRMPTGKSVRIICLTASAFDDEGRRAVAGGADGLLYKPIRDDSLLELIGELLNVDFESAADSSPVMSVWPGGPAVKQLPPELLQRLRTATLRADFDTLLNLIDEASAFDEQVATALRDLARQFANKRILELLNSADVS